MNIPQHLREFQAITRSATDRALFLALLTSRDRKLPLPLRLLAFVIMTALLWQVVMQSGLGVWNWADDGVRLLLVVLSALHLSLPVSGTLTLLALLLLGMCVTGVRAARVANERLLLVLDDVEQVEAEAGA
ncbi:hypothetical protein [Deinococcus wulumuqiensis]|uniref:Uncharacterized protein n=1 Tax=Deinococcus wulumuqiensis TaxID=980427 RepID=A0AAV4K7B2_9DEIO|nr:hypothetical protein [Deinococcus wulumuqiensis]QII22455.1 hypothetical protein G6R31_16495 [Deinococcus wulumuqiensis R12]GGI85797.1 hypothetical protein GCM10010914_20330 [Deinococcus wulumuqiensis]GGP30177.1 hypothetical protein GCM10008021_18280 [Deinococcus wulumuqiensis]